MRVLVVLSDPLGPDAIRMRCSELLAAGHDVAICYVVAAPSTLATSLEAQRRITVELRRALHASAEDIPVFVVTGQSGDGVHDCARDWGATDVRT